MLISLKKLVQKWDLSCREVECDAMKWTEWMQDAFHHGFVVSMNIWVWEQSGAWVVTVTDYSRETSCSVKVLLCLSFCHINGKIWPISGLRISAFQKLLERMCLYIDVIMEGVAWKTIVSIRLFIRSRVKCVYPSGQLLFTLIVLVFDILDTNTCSITYLWFDVL